MFSSTLVARDRPRGDERNKGRKFGLTTRFFGRFAAGRGVHETCDGGFEMGA